MFQTGQQIGIYTLIRQIGKGGVGEVWLAERRGLVTTRVAVKLPREENVEIDAIRQEAELWARVSGHPNVLPIIEANVYDGQVIIASEYAKDGSLRQLLREHPMLSVNQSIELTVGILRGLEHLHSHQIVHRDLKPENILLQGDTPRLTDFGISRTFSSAVSFDSSITGTPNYMSPEAFDGKRDICTDIWSVGVILYEMLSGRQPFPQKQMTELMGAIIYKDVPPLPDFVPPPLQKIVAESLAKQPLERYAAAREMLDDLRSVSSDFRQPEETKTVADEESRSREAEDSPFKTGVVMPAPDISQTVKIAFENDGLSEKEAASVGKKPMRFIAPVLAIILIGGISFFVLSSRQSVNTANQAAENSNAEITANVNSGAAENDFVPADSAPTADRFIDTGNEHHSRREYDAAIAAYTKAIELNPGYSPVYNNRGVAYGDKGDYKKAMADFRKALELDPDNRTAKINLTNLQKVRR